MCNSNAGLTITKTLPEYTTGMGAAHAMLNLAGHDIESALANGQQLSMRLVKCAGVGQWSLVVDECYCEEPVQMPLLPMMELEPCPK